MPLRCDILFTPRAISARLAVPYAPSLETIDHCFLACRKVKLVWSRFVPMLSALLSAPFVPNCPFVFFYQFPVPDRKCLRLLLYTIKSILSGIWKFRNKATFHKGRRSPELSLSLLLLMLNVGSKLTFIAFLRLSLIPSGFTQLYV